MSVVSMRKLLEAGVHFGHQTRRWDPRMKSYIYAAKNGIHIIDLEQTQQAIDEAYEFIKNMSEQGGKLLIVGTKKQAQQTVVEEALRSGSFYVNNRWLGGLLTNFRTMQKSIRRLIEIETMDANGSISIYTKKEQAVIRKEADKLEKNLGGIKEMRKLPDAVFVVDPLEDANAVAEAKKLKIPVFGLVDTNCDPAIVDFPIPSNDDAIRTIKLIVELMADAVVEAKGGILSAAHQNVEGDDITMEDVIVNVQRQHDEQTRRRRQKFDDKRRRPQRGRNPRQPNPRQAQPRRDASQTSAARPAAQTSTARPAAQTSTTRPASQSRPAEKTDDKK